LFPKKIRLQCCSLKLHCQDLHRHCRSKCHTFRRFCPARIVERRSLKYSLDKATKYLASGTHLTRHKITLPWIHTRQGTKRCCLGSSLNKARKDLASSINSVINATNNLAFGTHSTRHRRTLLQVFTQQGNGNERPCLGYTLNKLGTERSSLGYPLDKAPKIYLGHTR
jgi:hypothetical protein